MKHYIFIESGATIRFDFSKIFDGRNFSLYLIIEKSLYKKLSPSAIFSFRKIIVLDTASFHVDKLETLIRDIMTEYGLSKTDTSINTHDEYSLINCAKLRERFQIAGDRLDVIERFIDKIEMKKKAINLRQPKFLKFDYERYIKSPSVYTSEIIQTLGFPIFAKPTNMASCFKVAEIHSEKQLIDWLASMEREDSFELDEFIEGKMYHCDSVIQNGVIRNAFVYEYSSPNANFLKGQSTGSLILLPTDPLYDDLMAYNQKVIDEMELPLNTVTHFEFFVNKKNEKIFLEIAARAPGYEIPYALEKMTGFNIEEVFVKLQMRLDFEFDFSNKGLFASYMRYPRKKGTVASLNKPNIESQYSIIYNCNIQDTLEPSKNQAELAGIIVFWHEKYDTLKNDFDKLISFSPYTYIS